MTLAVFKGKDGKEIRYNTDFEGPKPQADQDQPRDTRQVVEELLMNELTNQRALHMTGRLSTELFDETARPIEDKPFHSAAQGDLVKTVEKKTKNCCPTVKPKLQNTAKKRRIDKSCQTGNDMAVQPALDMMKSLIKKGKHVDEMLVVYTCLTNIKNKFDDSSS